MELTTLLNDILFVLLAAPNQFAGPVVSASSSGMQFIPQPVNYAGVPQQFMPAGYGFYAPPMMHGTAVPAGFLVTSASAKQFSAVNGAHSGPGGSSAGLVAGGTQQTAAQPAPGSWPSQTHQVVNPFLVSIALIYFLKYTFQFQFFAHFSF